MTTQIIKTASGEELVVLAKAEYDELVATLAEAEEDLAHIAAYDAAKGDAAGSMRLSVEESVEILKRVTSQHE